MKKLMKKISTFALCVIIAVMMIVPLTAFAANPSFGISASSSTVAPNGTFTVKVGGECIGRVDLTVSNGTLSENKIWVENGYNSVTVTAGSSGTVTVTAIPYEGMSDIDANLYEPGSKSVTVTIVEPTPEPEPENPDTPSDEEDDKTSSEDDKTSNKEDDKTSNKEDDKTTSKEDTDKTSDSDSDKTSKPSTTNKDTGNKNSTEEKPVVEEPVEEKPVVEEEPVVEEPVEEEPVVEEPVVEEPVVEEPVEVDEPVERGCFIHWIIVIIMVVAAILTFVFRKSTAINILILAVAAIISVILDVLAGHCVADWIITVIGIVVLAILSMLFSSKIQVLDE